MKDHILLSRSAYFETLAHYARLARRGERIIVATMVFDAEEPAVIALVAALRAAAQHGANVTLLVDAHNFLQDIHGKIGPLFYDGSLDHLKGPFAEVAALLESLKQAGGHYRITNMPKHRFNPAMIGRSHIKGAVIGNRVFVGGCNLERPDQIDIMVSWQDAKTAEKVSNWLLKIAENGNVRQVFGDVDAEATLDADTKLLLDAGVPGQSLIYDEALALIDSAKEWIYMTCQYFPGGPTARHLAAAQKRGVRIEIDFSHPRSHAHAAALQYAHQAVQRARGLPRSFFDGTLDRDLPKLHAKIIATDKGVMFGSHNFVTYGVRFGTAELALKSSDVQFAQELKDFIRNQLNTFGKAKQKTTPLRKVSTK